MLPVGFHFFQKNLFPPFVSAGKGRLTETEFGRDNRTAGIVRDQPGKLRVLIPVPVPGSDVIIDHQDIPVRRPVGHGIFKPGVAHIVGAAGRIQRMGMRRSLPDIADGFLSLSIQLVSHAPGEDTGMISVGGDHLFQLREGDLSLQRAGVLRIRSPEGNLLLHQDPVTVAPVQDKVILLPVKPGEHAVAFL